jgi:acetyl-CoA carboxylase carboxyltransferase component
MPVLPTGVDPRSEAYRVNYAAMLGGRAYDPRFLFTWPNHRIAVMGPGSR